MQCNRIPSRSASPVSRLLFWGRHFPFKTVPASAFIETNAIALLSNYGRPPLDAPSPS